MQKLPTNIKNEQFPVFYILNTDIQHINSFLLKAGRPVSFFEIQTSFPQIQLIDFLREDHFPNIVILKCKLNESFPQAGVKEFLSKIYPPYKNDIKSLFQNLRTEADSLLNSSELRKFFEKVKKRLQDVSNEDPITFDDFREELRVLITSPGSLNFRNFVHSEIYAALVELHETNNEQSDGSNQGTGHKSEIHIKIELNEFFLCAGEMITKIWDSVLHTSVQERNANVPLLFLMNEISGIVMNTFRLKPAIIKERVFSYCDGGVGYNGQKLREYIEKSISYSARYDSQYSHPTEIIVSGKGNVKDDSLPKVIAPFLPPILRTLNKPISIEELTIQANAVVTHAPEKKPFSSETILEAVRFVPGRFSTFSADSKIQLNPDAQFLNQYFLSVSSLLSEFNPTENLEGIVAFTIKSSEDISGQIKNYVFTRPVIFARHVKDIKVAWEDLREKKYNSPLYDFFNLLHVIGLTDADIFSYRVLKVSFYYEYHENLKKLLDVYLDRYSPVLNFEEDPQNILRGKLMSMKDDYLGTKNLSFLRDYCLTNGEFEMDESIRKRIKESLSSYREQFYFRPDGEIGVWHTTHFKSEDEAISHAVELLQDGFEEYEEVRRSLL